MKQIEVARNQLGAQSGKAGAKLDPAQGNNRGLAAERITLPQIQNKKAKRNNEPLRSVDEYDNNKPSSIPNLPSIAK